MEKILTAIGKAALVITLIFGMSVITGSILWLLYPHIHALFPTAAEKGIIAQNLKWWDAVCISWIIFALFKSYISGNSKD